MFSAWYRTPLYDKNGRRSGCKSDAGTDSVATKLDVACSLGILFHNFSCIGHEYDDDRENKQITIN